MTGVERLFWAWRIQFPIILKSDIYVQNQNFFLMIFLRIFFNISEKISYVIFFKFLQTYKTKKIHYLRFMKKKLVKENENFWGFAHM